MRLFDRLREGFTLGKSEARRLRYRCRECGVRYKRRHLPCPQCGSYQVGRDEGGAG